MTVFCLPGSPRESEYLLSSSKTGLIFLMSVPIFVGQFLPGGVFECIPAIYTTLCCIYDLVISCATTFWINVSEVLKDRNVSIHLE